MTSLQEEQDIIKKFNDVRQWSTPSSMKDLMLNVSEEIGEMWNVIKWVDVPTQQKLIAENKPEVENFIGDMFYLVFKMSYLCGVDPQKSIDNVMNEYEQRFPLEKMQGKHANKLAGGIDLKGKTD